MGRNDISELLKLDKAERLAIAEQLLESVSDETNQAPLSEAEKAYVQQRLESYRKNPEATIPWAKVKQNLGL